MPVVIGGIEAWLRRIAHFDYWSEKVRRSVLMDAKADLLVYGNAERQICEIAHRLAAGERIDDITDLRGTAFVRKAHARRLDRDRLHERRHARAAESAGRPVRDGTLRRYGDPGDVGPPFRTRPGGRRDASLGLRARRPCRARPPGRAERRADVTVASTETVLRFDRRIPEERRPRPQRDPAAVVRAGRRRRGAVRPRLAHPPPGVEPGQCARAGAAPRRRGRVAQPAADSAHDEGDGRDLRAALPARAASGLRRGEDPRLRDDPLLDRDPARLLRRLHVLLDHRARGPHHPEPLRGLGHPRDRDDPRLGARASRA